MSKLTVSPENADLYLGWIATRGGVALWRSINLSNPGASWCTPALTSDGGPTPKPTWQADSQPERIVKDPAEVEVVEPVEVKRFYVAIRPGSQGLSLKVSDGGSRRIRREVSKAGGGSWYEFDYSTQEAVIFRPGKTTSLADWKPAEVIER